MNDSADSQEVSAEKRAAVRSLFDDLPDDFDKRHAALKLIREEFHSYLARAIEPALNKYIQKLPQETLEEKRQAAGIVNGLVRSVGLTIRDEAGRPSRLIADTEIAGDPDTSRFRLEGLDMNGRKRRSGAKQYILDLTLMTDRPREKFWAKRLEDRPQSREL